MASKRVEQGAGQADSIRLWASVSVSVRGKTRNAAQDRAEALGWGMGPRDGIGDQIRYLGMRVAPPGLGVNVGSMDF